VKSLAEHLAEIGAKGGSATGKTKKRGGADYYRKLAAKSAKARRRKRGPPQKGDDRA
jgi:hypothetical protein